MSDQVGHDQVVVIGAIEENRVWLENLLASLRGCKYQVYIVVNKAGCASLDFLHFTLRNCSYHLQIFRNAQEPGVLNAIFANTFVEEFLFLHDTCEILDHGLLDLVFQTHRGRVVALAPKGYMYLMKYTRRDLTNFGLPTVYTKFASAMQEMRWCGQFLEFSGGVTLFPEFVDGNVFVEKFGQRRMLLENSYLRKYKGCWDPAMITDRV